MLAPKRPRVRWLLAAAAAGHAARGATISDPPISHRRSERQRKGGATDDVSPAIARPGVGLGARVAAAVTGVAGAMSGSGVAGAASGSGMAGAGGAVATV